MARVSLTSNAGSVENGTQITLGLRQLKGLVNRTAGNKRDGHALGRVFRMKVLWDLGLGVKVVTTVDLHHDETRRVDRMEALLGKTFASVDSSAVRGWNASWQGEGDGRVDSK